MVVDLIIKSKILNLSFTICNLLRHSRRTKKRPLSNIKCHSQFGHADVSPRLTDFWLSSSLMASNSLVLSSTSWLFWS